MKPRLIVYSTNRDLTTSIVLKFAQGVTRATNTWDVKFKQIDRHRKDGFRGLTPGIDAVATLGILRGTGVMLKEAADIGLDYYYMDHAYFNSGYKGKGWMRITKNSHSMNKLQLSTPKRYSQLFANENKIMPWLSHRYRGDRIVICPPTHAVSWYAGIDTNHWVDNVVAQLKRILPTNEHNRIVIRYKPKEPVVDQQGNLLNMKQNPVTGNLNKDLDQACCVIAYNSMVALEATLRGLPVIVSDYSCCYPIGFKIQDFATPSIFDNEPIDRERLIYWLANNQWNIQEIQSGQAWTMLQENNNGI